MLTIHKALHHGGCVSSTDMGASDMGHLTIHRRGHRAQLVGYTRTDGAPDRTISPTWGTEEART